MNKISDIAALLSSVNSHVLYIKSIEDATQNILKLNDSLTLLTSSIQRLNNFVMSGNATNRVVDSNVNTNYQDSISKPVSGVPAQQDKQDNSFLKQAEGYTKIAKSIGKVAKESFDMAESAGMISKKMAKLKPVFKGINGLIEVAEGVEAAAVATDAVAGITSAGTIITGAESIAGAATAATGPYGMLIGLGVLGVAGTAAYLLNDYEKHKKESGENNFLFQGIKSKNPYLTKMLEANNSVDALIEQSRMAAPAQLKKDKKNIVRNLLKSGNDIMFDSELAASSPVYLDALVATFDKNLQLPNQQKKNLVFDNALDQKKFSELFDRAHLYSTKVLPQTAYQVDLPGETGTFSPLEQRKRRQRAKTDLLHFMPWMDAALETLLQDYNAHGLPYVELERSNWLKKFGTIRLRRNSRKRYGMSLQRLLNRIKSSSIMALTERKVKANIIMQLPEVLQQ